jgi:sphingomyelin phosphodiesterase 2
MFIGMPEQLAGRLSVASLNTRGVPVLGSQLAGRYAAIGTAFEAGPAEVACFQEVLTYGHLRLLVQRMPSFAHVSYRSSFAGPAGGLVTFSRLPVSSSVYRGFGSPPGEPGISRLGQLRARKGALVTRMARLGLCIVNTHPVANRDGDWSRANRFYPLHRAQLAALTRIMRGIRVPAVVCGDFNVDRGSSLFAEFVAGTGLANAFEGNCPATFRAEYLRAGEVGHCIDFILTPAGSKLRPPGCCSPAKWSFPGARGMPQTTSACMRTCSWRRAAVASQIPDDELG